MLIALADIHHLGPRGAQGHTEQVDNLPRQRFLEHPSRPHRPRLFSPMPRIKGNNYATQFLQRAWPRNAQALFPGVKIQLTALGL